VDLSIIIVNWNTRELLAGCLFSLYTAASQVESEVWVVDNASDDESTSMVRQQFPQVHLIENRQNAGFARANNQAIYQSQGRYVLLLNSDTEVLPGALETMVKFMNAHAQCGGCGPQLVNADDTLQVSCHPMLTPGREFWRLMFLDRLWRRATYAQGRWDRELPRRVEVIKGACFLLRQTALEQVGSLDEQYFMYSEEMDLCYRLAQADWQLWWVPTARVRHYGEASSRQMAEAMYVELYRSKVQFHRKFGGTRRAAHFRRLLRLAFSPRLAVTAVAAPFSPSLTARVHIYRRLLAELDEM
jgi:N-acetylglucosaminyl-diphospho-decaprenol L-rhamnosyltransferase